MIVNCAQIMAAIVIGQSNVLSINYSFNDLFLNVNVVIM